LLKNDLTVLGEGTEGEKPRKLMREVHYDGQAHLWQYLA
jgi:hypothetical protein